jgi:hypothetical protein
MGFDIPLWGMRLPQLGGFVKQARCDILLHGDRNPNGFSAIPPPRPGTACSRPKKPALRPLVECGIGCLFGGRAPLARMEYPHPALVIIGLFGVLHVLPTSETTSKVAGWRGDVPQAAADPRCRGEAP